MSPAVVPLVLLSIAAPLGAFDVAYYHLWKFRLFQRPASRAETTAHLVRGVVFSAVVLLLGVVEPHGAWYWLIALLVVADFTNSAADVALEPASRKDFGGLPALESVIHLAGATLSGAAAGAWLLGAWSLRLLPTELSNTEGLPLWLRANAVVMAVGSLLITTAEAGLMLKSWSKSRQRAVAEVVA